MAMILTFKRCDPNKEPIAEIETDKKNSEQLSKRQFNLEPLSLSYIDDNYCVLQKGEWVPLQNDDCLHIDNQIYQVCLEAQEEQQSKEPTPNTVAQKEPSQTVDNIQTATNTPKENSHGSFEMAPNLTTKIVNPPQPVFIDDALLPSKLPADPLGFLQSGAKTLQQTAPTSQPVSLTTPKFQATVTPQLLEPLNRQYKAPRPMSANQFNQTQIHASQPLPLLSTAINAQEGNIMQDLNQHVLTNTPNHLHDLATKTQIQSFLSQHQQEKASRQCYHDNEQDQLLIQKYHRKKRRSNFLKRLGLI